MVRILILVSLIPNLLWSQASFYNTYSDKGYDVGEGILQLKDSSYIITGSSGSFSSNKQAFILKIDKYGTREWSKNYGGSEADQGRRVFRIENDGIYVVGQTNSYPDKFFDAYFFKTDLSGNLQFEKNYGSNAYENIHDALLLKDTSFILVGETTNTSNEQENLYLLRINKFGDTIWTKNFGSNGKDVARSVKLLNDSTFIVAGEYYVSDSLTQKALLFSMHINGTTNWFKTYGKKGKYVLNDLSIAQDGIRSVGYSQIDPMNQSFKALTRFFTDFNGNEKQQETDYSSGDFSIEQVVQFGNDPNDYFYAMKIENATSSLTNYPNGCDLYIYHFWSDLFYAGTAFAPSYIGNDVPNQMIKTSDGGVIIVGSNETPKNGGTNVLLVKIGPNLDFKYSHTIPAHQTLVTVNELNSEKHFSLFPNPTQNLLIIQSKEDKEINQIEVFNQFGMLVENIESPSNSTISVAHLENGIYFIKIDDAQFKFVKF